MKNLVILLLFVSTIIQAQTLDWKTFKPISKNYFFVNEVLYTRERIIVRNTYDYIPAQKIRWIGSDQNAHIVAVYGNKDVTVEGLDISVDSGSMATSGLYISDSGTVLVKNCTIRKTKWGIRAFQGFESNIIIKYCTIDSTWDDNLYGQNTNNWDISYSSFTNPNMWQAEGGGDCIQLAYRQNDIHIHHCLMDHSTSVHKFCTIVGSNDYVMGTLDYHDNVIIARKSRVGELSNSGMYLKPKNKFLIYNNTFINGANAIYERDAKPCYLKAFGNNFFGQSECMYLNDAWHNVIYDNTFTNGGIKYLWGSAVGDSIYNNIFYTNPSLSSVFNFYSKTPAYSVNQIDPIPGTIVEPIQYYDTIIYYDTVEYKQIKYDTVGVAKLLKDYLNSCISKDRYEIQIVPK